MLALLGSLLGFLSNTVPEFLKLFRDSQDRRHELAILGRQMEQQRLGHALGRGVAGLGAPGHHLCVLLGLAVMKASALATLLQTEGITLAAALQAT
jgi:hypothetical protein